jgi:hypothetical protein
MSNQKSSAALENTVTSLRSELPNRALLDRAQTWWSTVAEYQQEYQQEVGHFVSDRLAKDGEAIKETFTSRNWPDALAVQARWMDETIRDYNAELTKLTKLYTKAAASTARSESRSS